MSYSLLFCLSCVHPIVVPVRPNATHNVNSTAIQVDIDVPVSGFNVSRYCVTFTWLAVSNVPLNASITTTLCGLTSTITLSPVQEDATYEYYATVNNTASSISQRSAVNYARTYATREFMVDEFCFATASKKTCGRPLRLSFV